MQFTLFSRAVGSVRSILSTCWRCDPRNERGVPSAVTTDHLGSEDRKQSRISAGQCHCHFIRKARGRGYIDVGELSAAGGSRKDSGLKLFERDPVSLTLSTQ